MGKTHRIAALRAGLRTAGVEGYVSLSSPANAYLTGFLGSTSAVIVTQEAARFLCDFRYGEIASSQVSDFSVSVVSGKLEARTGEALKALGIANVGFDPAVTTVQQHNALSEAFGGKLVSLPDLLDGLRAIKDAEELQLIREASELAEQVLHSVKAGLKEAVAEREIAAQICYELQRNGAEKVAFDPIVLFGERSSLPHGVPGDRPLQMGDIVLIDMGCRRAGYCSDLTRTYIFGTISAAWFEDIYKVTLHAQECALRALRGGATAREVDAVARSLIEEAGFGTYFGHGLGHGVGLEVHESIRLNAQSNQVLAPGMVVTVEPGIYLPGKGGVRIEDLVVVTSDGCNVLTHSPKELEVLAV